jgi:hypothetical protein
MKQFINLSSLIPMAGSRTKAETTFIEVESLRAGAKEE